MHRSCLQRMIVLVIAVAEVGQIACHQRILEMYEMVAAVVAVEAQKRRVIRSIALDPVVTELRELLLRSLVDLGEVAHRQRNPIQAESPLASSALEERVRLGVGVWMIRELQSLLLGEGPFRLRIDLAAGLFELARDLDQGKDWIWPFARLISRYCVSPSPNSMVYHHLRQHPTSKGRVLAPPSPISLTRT
jgi:hypothetical protein